MDTNSEKLLLKDEVFQIVGCAIEVLNTLGHGLVEKPYENALVVEFLLRKIPFRLQPSFDVVYCIFAASHNYVYNTALLPPDPATGAGIPYGQKGFIVVKKGGDAAIFRAGQAQAANWPSPQTFQTQVGMLPNDQEGGALRA